MTVQAIKSAIKTILQDQDLRKVTNWLNAEPHPLTFPSLCFGWLEWAGGPVQRDSSDQTTVIDNFYIVIVTKNVDSEQGEKDAINLAEKAMSFSVQILSNRVL